MEIENTESIRKTLAEEIELMRKGDSNPSRANAIANMVGKILASVRLDIEVHKYIAKADALNLTVSLVKKLKKKN